MGNKHTYLEVKNILNRLGYTLLDNEYINNRYKFTITDNEGYYYYTNLFNLLSSESKPSKFHIANPYTIQNLKLWCVLNNKLFEIISTEYQGSNKYLQWQCLNDDCGEIFDATWQNIQSHWGCSYCAGKKVGLSNCLATKNPELATEWHPILNGKTTPYDVTSGSSKQIYWQCSKNLKHIWSASIKNRNYNESGCPYCNNRISSEDNNLYINNPTLCDDWNYRLNNKFPQQFLPNSNEVVWWKCKDCGHEWQASILNRNYSHSGCPECKVSSKGEEYIKDYLTKINILFIHQYRFNDCKNKIPLPFDFYLPYFNICIEYHGIQHYNAVKHFGGESQLAIQKLNDSIKKKYCDTNNIKLLIIPYWEYNNVPVLLSSLVKESAIK